MQQSFVREIPPYAGGARSHTREGSSSSSATAAGTGTCADKPASSSSASEAKASVATTRLHTHGAESTARRRLSDATLLPPRSSGLEAVVAAAAAAELPYAAVYSNFVPPPLQTLTGEDRCALCRSRRRDCIVESSKYGRPKACQSCGKSKTRCSLVKRDDEEGQQPSKSPHIAPGTLPSVRDPGPTTTPASALQIATQPSPSSSSSRSPANRLSIAELPVYDERPPGLARRATSQDLLDRTLALLRDLTLAVFACDPLRSPLPFSPAQAVGVGINTLLKRIEDLQNAQATVDEVEERTEAIVADVQDALRRSLAIRPTHEIPATTTASTSRSRTMSDADIDELEEPTNKKMRMNSNEST